MSPLTFVPHFRPQVWGGRRLETVLGKPLPAEGRFGESWELSDHKLHQSRVATGPLAGQTLAEVWRSDDPRGASAFPLLVKWLDCDELLSVQVHPTDSLAQKLLNEPRGKTEAWVIVYAEPDARIYAGLKPGVDQAELESRLDEGTVADCLHSFAPVCGDVVYIPAGTVHAAGGGIVMAEVQQTSDATFRLFDWNRPGPDGKPRALHREQALACINWSAGPVNPLTRISLDAPSASSRRPILTCPYFAFELIDVANQPQRLRLPNDCWSIMMTLSGTLNVAADQDATTLKAGSTCLVPSSESGWHVSSQESGGAVALWVHLV
jgi:mannose-6-phosphate isomerase